MFGDLLEYLELLESLVMAFIGAGILVEWRNYTNKIQSIISGDCEFAYASCPILD